MTATNPPSDESSPVSPDESAVERERLLELSRYAILDTPPDESFNDLARLAASLCQAPMAAVGFIERERQWFKAGVGLDLVEMPRRSGFCHFTIQQSDVFEVPDASADSQFAGSPPVTGEARVRFYAGVPLITANGHALGTLFVQDQQPRELSPEQKRSLLALGRLAMVSLECRRVRELQGQQDTELRHLQAVTDQRILSRTADLKAANEQLETFAYSVSHDLCSPLRAIDTYSQMLTRDFGSNLGEEARRHLELICQNVRQMRQLITGLLQFSRFSRQPLHKQRIALSAFVSRIVEEMPEENEGRGRMIEISELPDCHADPLLLKQLFVNLLSNALKFARFRSPASIVIGWERRGDEIVYFVRDNGVGFDMQYADRLFGVFQRLHRSEEFEGTGVGLSIVKRIVHRHGGRVWAQGKVNGGATFYFFLPPDSSTGPLFARI